MDLPLILNHFLCSPRGVTFWAQQYVATCYQATGDNAGKPSLLVFYPRAKKEVYKIIELWLKPDLPFTGTCGGIALAYNYLYVSL